MNMRVRSTSSVFVSETPTPVVPWIAPPVHVAAELQVPPLPVTVRPPLPVLARTMPLTGSAAAVLFPGRDPNEGQFVA